ncbi:hypothetical protein BGY98DRAFT_1089761 [Russula aff. rugulosa BPL654]|nr:hypothetical protein BGY98DRAFT_1089761 [Russula aff. rugulosa BPL654]
MHPFGGTSICPRCSKAVYAAEQVMGPGRKPCLACTSCNVRLDSFRLLEHDELNCHSRNFGTRDLRQANLPHTPKDLSPSPPRAGRHPLPHASSAPSPGPLLRPTRVLSPTRGAFNTDSEQIDGTDSTTDQGSDDSQFTPSHVGRSENGLPRTVPLSALGRANSLSGNGAIGARRVAPLAASTTGTRYGAALMGELRSTPTGSPVRQWGGGTPQCPRCNKNVYFAEQVKAVGKTWHKGCFRCSECGTSLDSNRLTERDGAPFCNRCYNKLHGPAGSGYALLGKAGG